MEKRDAIAALGALAQDTRLDIFRFLVAEGPAGLPAGQIAARFGLPSATLSFHLKEMKQAGLVASQREGRSLIYAADISVMNDLMGYLMEHCCQGHPELCLLDRPAPPTQ